MFIKSTQLDSSFGSWEQSSNLNQRPSDWPPISLDSASLLQLKQHWFKSTASDGAINKNDFPPMTLNTMLKPTTATTEFFYCLKPLPFVSHSLGGILKHILMIIRV